MLTTPEAWQKVLKVLEYLGRGQNEGEVRGKHLTQILSYMATIRREEYDNAVAKMCILLGISKRYLKENYIDGLVAWNILAIENEKNKRFLMFNGVSCE